MKRSLKIFTIVALITLSISCKKDEPTDIATNDYSNLLADYASTTIIATYADMKDNAKELYENVESFKSSKNQSDIDAACASWKSTRAPWESGESFLFGPAAYNNLDPLLDSWPLDQAQLDQVLSGSQILTPDFVREGLGAVLKGFHTVEYLLFRNGKNRNATDFTQRETEYLVAVCQVLRDDCITLWALWNGVEEGSMEAHVLEKLEIDVSSPYINEFVNAGKAGSRYTAQRDAVDEILQGIIDIADEVANGKLADPFTTKDVLVVESWHSWNSLTDFKNNIRSIENAYTSSYGNNSAKNSISSMVKKVNVDLDKRTKETIQAGIEALQKINEPYRNNLDDNINIPAAIDAINNIFEIFNAEVKPAVLE